MAVPPTAGGAVRGGVELRTHPDGQVLAGYDA